VPGARVTVEEVAPWSGVVTLVLNGQKVPLGLKASRTIWVLPAGL